MHLFAELHNYYLNIDAIKGIPALPFLLFTCLLGLFTFYFFYQWYKNFIKARSLEDTPTARIRSAAQGYVELFGVQKFLNNEPIIAPLSKLSCTWYRYTIEKAKGNRWIPIEYGMSEKLFELDDDTGICIIDPKGAQITTPIHDVWLGFRHYPKGKPKNFIWRFIGSFGNYRYQEHRMEEGMSLYAAGNFHTMSENNDPYNLLSGKGLTARDPFILSASLKKHAISTFKVDAIIWFLAYILLLVGIAWLSIIHFG